MAVSIPQVVTEDRASGAQFIDGSVVFNADLNQYLSKTQVVKEIEELGLGVVGSREKRLIRKMDYSYVPILMPIPTIHLFILTLLTN